MIPNPNGSGETVEKAPIKAKTAFVVVQAENGAYYALNSLDNKIEVERSATLQDIKVACGEVRDAVFRADLTNSIASLFAQKPVSEAQEPDTSAPEAQ